MKARDGLYRCTRVASAYAFGRPAVHPRIAQRIASHLGPRIPFARALDVGCGAGRSAAALEAIATTVVGIDPASAMLTHARAVAPAARFVVGAAERLPFGDDAFDLVTAAGSLNYADVDRALLEAARVLAADGALVIYDFSTGRRARGSPALEDWHADFRQRYPSQPGYHLEVRELPFERYGLRLDAYETAEIGLPMDAEAYVAYAMSETGVALAVIRGAPEQDIREWCRQTLGPVFAGQAREVLFDAYVAYASPAPDSLCGEARFSLR